MWSVWTIHATKVHCSEARRAGSSLIQVIIHCSFFLKKPCLVERLVDVVYPRHCVFLGRVSGQLEAFSDVALYTSHCFWTHPRWEKLIVAQIEIGDALFAVFLGHLCVHHEERVDVG